MGQVAHFILRMGRRSCKSTTLGYGRYLAESRDMSSSGSWMDDGLHDRPNSFDLFYAQKPRAMPIAILEITQKTITKKLGHGNKIIRRSLRGCSCASRLEWGLWVVGLDRSRLRTWWRLWMDVEAKNSRTLGAGTQFGFQAHGFERSAIAFLVFCGCCYCVAGV